MKAVVQRVSKAKIVVNGEVISSINEGLLAFIGIGRYDTEAEADYVASKLLSNKMFDNFGGGKRWRKSVQELNLEVLCVSQFTLYNSWKSGRPDFHLAMPTKEANVLYDKFIAIMKEMYSPDKVKEGKFGACMQVESVNEGPVTFEIVSLESKRLDFSTPTTSLDLPEMNPHEIELKFN